MAGGHGRVDIKLLDIDLAPQMKEILEKTGNDFVREVKAGSLDKSGDYAGGWTFEFNGANTITGFNNGPHKTLTHLLEQGHAIVRNGKRIGHAAGKAHIDPAFKKAQGIYMKEMENIKIKPKK